MKAKILAVSTAVLLSMSVAANSAECDKESGPWLHVGSGKACHPGEYSTPFGTVSVGEINLYPVAGVIACAVMHRARVCSRLAKILK
jgi:hypothetical protein